MADLSRLLAAQHDLALAVAQTDERQRVYDLAVSDAYQSGVSVIALSEALGVSRTSIYKVLDRAEKDLVVGG